MKASVSAEVPRTLAVDDKQASGVTPPSFLQIARDGSAAAPDYSPMANHYMDGSRIAFDPIRYDAYRIVTD